jgi:hypothetical protein
MTSDLQETRAWARGAAIPRQRAAGHFPHLDDDRDAPGVEPLGAGWITVTVVIGVMAALIALGGMVLSFRAVSVEMAPAFGSRWAWLVPIVVDLTVFVFSGVDLVLARLDMSHPLARWTVYGATGGTVYLNYAAGGTVPGRIAHVLMPSIWVVFVELIRHVVRSQVGLATGSRREAIPAARWLLSPWPTLKLWRRMVLWRVSSYPRAVDQEKRRLGAVAAARELHGRLWRWRLSPLTRLRINLGEIGAADLWPVAAAPIAPPVPPAMPSVPAAMPTFDAPVPPVDVQRTTAAVPPEPASQGDLLAAARRIERWNGLPSASRIAQELAVSMEAANSIAHTLFAEDQRTATVRPRPDRFAD